MWKLLKNTITQTADTVLDRMERITYIDWFDTECEQATIRKNLAYKRMQQRNHTRKAVEEYRTARKEEKRIHKRKKKIFIEHELKELEHLRSNNESKSFYQKPNKSRKDFQPRTTLCRSEEGILLSEEDDILSIWAEHFDELLNTETSNQKNIINQEIHKVHLAIEEPIPTLDEVNNIIQKLKDNKAPGIDLIQAELIKKASLNFVEHMHQLITNIWITENIPEDWNWSIICPIHKKGDVTICSNYRGISLLCVAHKIFSNILFNRLLPYTETITGDYQRGYRQGRSTIDQIFTVRQILEKCNEHNKDTHHLFIYFKAAYDSIDRSRLYAAMGEMNIPQKLIALVKATMNNTQCRVKIQNRLSAPINIKNGIWQGDALACLLFNVALEKVVRDAALNIRGTIFYKSIQIIAYADDIDIIGRTQSAMIEAFNSLEKAAKDMNLLVNQEKSKYMPVTKRSHTHYPHYLEVGPYKFEVIHRFNYLGSNVNCNNDISEEIHKRILAANRCFHGLRKHLRSYLTSRNTKTLMYKVLIRPVLTYASETWTLSKTNERQLGLFERRVLRCIFGAKQENGTWRKRYNHELYELFNDSNIVNYIKTKRLAWAGHLIRMSNERTLKKIFNTKPEGTRSVGRPKL